MIIVLGSVVARADAYAEALRISREHVARSRREAGCVAHAVFEDPEVPWRLVFVERWADHAALLAHFQVPASRAFARALSGLAAQPPRIEIYEANELRTAGVPEGGTAASAGAGAGGSGGRR